MKVNELAKELGMSSPDLMAKLKSLKVNVKNQASVLDKNIVSILRKAVLESKVSAGRNTKILNSKSLKPSDKVKKKKPSPVKVKTKEVTRKVAPKAKTAKRTRTPPETAISKKKEDVLLETKPGFKIYREKIEPHAKPEAELPNKTEKVGTGVIPAVSVPEEGLKIVELSLPITVKDLSVKLQEKPSVLIKRLIDKGVMAGINQVLEEKIAEDICKSYGFAIKKALTEEEIAISVHQEKDLPHLLKPRAPVVTLMGHVDHGKTSLLDAIRESKLAQREAGGITQHIGAYRVILPKGNITFLDTPGHEAFTAMRARGARITDIVVLVVAADDGIMPQTIEAIDHAREANVPIIVAINKIDKPQANIDKVKKQLSELDLRPEDWQGSTITVAVSAKTLQGIDELLEMILLEAEMLELKANYTKLARGVVIESKLNKAKGYIATLLVQNGTLCLNDNVIIGKFYGKVKAMFDDRGKSITEATPSMPVEMLGISGVLTGGEQFFVIDDEKKARNIAAYREEQEKLAQTKTVKRISLEDLYVDIKEGKVKELKLILKADVKGSLEAIRESFKKINTAEIKLSVIHEGTGSINISDVVLASASNALIIGFHVEVEEKAKELIAKEGIDVRTYNIIYEIHNDIKSALEGMLEPEIKKTFLGRAEVRKVFQLSRSGTIAGCFVVKGKIPRNADIALIRNGAVILEGTISSLKRFKDDVKDVSEGFECGISISGFKDLKVGDIIEAHDIKKISRKL